MVGVVKYSAWYDTALCRKCPDWLFVFGDNLRGFGKGGQAIIRSEPNAFGVPTKRQPAMTPGSFFRDENDADLEAVLASLENLWVEVEGGKTIVVPFENGLPSLGTERAKLPILAPKLYETICNHITEMAGAHGWTNISSEDDLLALYKGELI